jgi:antitoxin (DNA-binding transcriptional repressor) of toxin-antitoxin stability system
MTAKVGIRELQTQASEIVRRLREDHESFELTYRGETVGQIIPMKPQIDHEAIDKSWEEWESIFDEIAAHVVDDVSADETMREIRREL